MKQKFIIAGVCLCLISGKTAFSQNSVPLQFNTLAFSEAANDAIDNPPPASEANVNSKAVVHFHRDYPTASKTTWTTDASGSTVRFVSSGVEMFQHYDLKGRWKCTIKNFEISQVPTEVADRVTDAYPGCRIFFARECIVPEGEAHVIKIESPGHLKTLIVLDNDINVLEDFDTP